jgi:hypothetical protein
MGLSFTIAAGPRSVFILGSESSGTRDHILLCQIRAFPFFASYDSQGYGGGIRPRLHTGRIWSVSCLTFLLLLLPNHWLCLLLIISWHGPCRNTPFKTVTLLWVLVVAGRCLPSVAQKRSFFAEPQPSNGFIRHNTMGNKITVLGSTQSCEKEQDVAVSTAVCIASLQIAAPHSA